MIYFLFKGMTNILKRCSFLASENAIITAFFEILTIYLQGFKNLAGI